MRDIFNDPKFERFLEGGISDLEEEVGLLVYNLYKAGIQTTWSCTGHIANFLEDGGGNASSGNLVYQPGLLFYKNTPKAYVLTRELEGVVKFHDFAKLVPGKEFQFYLEMEDLATSYNSRDYARKQVPRKQAEKRHKEFIRIWRSLTNWSSKL